MKKSVKQRIEEVARTVTAIQDLSLARLRSRRSEGLADYEVAVTGIIAALKRVNQDEIWREAAARLTALRATRGDATRVTGSLIRNAIQCRTVLRNDVHECLVETLQAEMDAAFKDAIMSNRYAALATRLSRWPCARAVEVAEDSRSARVNSRRLYLLAVGDVFAVSGVVLEVKLERKIDEITFEELLRITGDVRNCALTIAYIMMKPGSVRLFIEVTSEDADKLKRLFREGELRTVGGIPIEAIAKGKAAPVAALKESAPVMLDLRQPLTETDQRKLAEFVDNEQERSRQAAPIWTTGAWTTLSNILCWLTGLDRRPQISILARFTLLVMFAASSLCKSSLNLVFVWFPRWFGTNESLERLRHSSSYCIVNPWDDLNRVRLVEESLNAFVVWPMITAMTIAIVLLAFVHPDLSVLLWAAASGAFLSSAGGLVCSSVLSIRACGAAGVFIGIAFGVVHGLIAFANGGVESLAAAVARGDVFTRIVGGLVAVDAHRSMGVSLASALLALGLPAIGIASTARLMAQPLTLTEPNRRRVGKEIWGVILGSLTGIGVFLLMKTSQLLGHFIDTRTAFLIANGFISLVALSCLFRLRVVEHEQAGQKRADYGEELIQRLSLDLTRKYGRGFGVVQVAVMRQFFLAFPNAGIFQSVIEKSSVEAGVGPQTQILQSLIEKSAADAPPTTGQSKTGEFTRRSSAKFARVLQRLSQVARNFPLPWTHYVRVLRVRNPQEFPNRTTACGKAQEIAVQRRTFHLAARRN